jgi:hypothetical protein
LAVVQRKAELLHEVESRISALEEANAVRDELLKQLLEGTGKAPAAYAGILKFISSHTHAGDPAVADKSDFKAFATSFKLPASHHKLVYLQKLSSEIGEWWAEACVSEASNGAEHVALQRLFDVAIGTGVDRKHFKLVRATRILNERMADRVLKEAIERLERDKKRVERVGPASEDADAIEASIQKAISDGVPSGAAKLAEALTVAKELRELDGQRKRLEGRRKRDVDSKAGNVLR